MGERKRETPAYALARFVVDKRKAFYVLFIIAVLYCASSISKTNISNDITEFLPEGTQTQIGIEIMAEEFTEFGSAQVMVSNISYEAAAALADKISVIDGVDAVSFDNSEDHFKDSAALYGISFDEPGGHELSALAMSEIRQLLEPYDSYISSYVGMDLNEIMQREMTVIMLIAVAVIIAVLFFTSKSYLEVLVFFIVFPVAAILNMGTNYVFESVSFITNAIAVILQLALAIDYSIILCHRFMDELEERPVREAAIESLSKAIIEVSSSSLTTIAGLLALTFMQFRLGLDLGRVLIKGIICSLITVFFLMPGLLVMFSKGIKKTRHNSFVPDISGWGRLIMRLRHVLPIVFFVVAGFCVYFSGQAEYAFSENSISTRRPSEMQVAASKISETFGLDNTIALLVPTGSYEDERRILNRVEALPEIESALGLANVEISDGYVLTDSLSPRQFSELTGAELEMVRLLYQAYGVSSGQYGAVFQETDEYSIPLIDIFLFLFEQREAGVITLDGEQFGEDMDEMHDLLLKAKAQLAGENWSRLVFVTNLPEEGAESYALLDTISAIAGDYYSDTVLVGNTTNARDFSVSFSSDNNMISILTVVFVLIILLFTFKSAGLPVLLVFTIQGSIWINFSFPYITGNNLFFVAYLIVSAIQMGATIDYAIVITNRYMELKQSMDKKDAAIAAISQSFATVFTSGSILTLAGFLISELTSFAIISSLGLALGRGALISIILVMTVLPALLVMGDAIIEKTAFTLKRDRTTRFNKGTMYVDGHIRGNISGYVDAEIKGLVRGDVEALVENKEGRKPEVETDENEN